MKKSFLIPAISLLSSMSLLFTGCGEKTSVTYEDLMESYQSTFDKMDATVEMGFSLNYEGDEMSGTLMEVDIAADIRTTASISYTEVTVDASVFGMSQTMEQQLYCDGTNTYIKEDDAEDWSVSADADGEDDMWNYSELFLSLKNLPDYMSDGKIESGENGLETDDAENYIVTGTICYSDVPAFLGMENTEYEEAFPDIFVTMQFSAEDNAIQYISFVEKASEEEDDSSEESTDSEESTESEESSEATESTAEEDEDEWAEIFDGLSFDGMEITITFHDTSNMEDVTIPEDVVKSATEEDPNDA